MVLTKENLKEESIKKIKELRKRVDKLFKIKGRRILLYKPEIEDIGCELTILEKKLDM